MYECEMYVFVRENKSLTTAEEIMGGWIPDFLLEMKNMHIFKFCWKGAFYGEYRSDVSCYLVGSRLHSCLGWSSRFLSGRIQVSRWLTWRRDELTVIWSDPGFAENSLKLNSHLVGSRLHNNLVGMRKLIVIWWDPGFTVTYRRKGWINYYLVGSRLCRFFFWNWIVIWACPRFMVF